MVYYGSISIPLSYYKIIIDFSFNDDSGIDNFMNRWQLYIYIFAKKSATGSKTYRYTT